MVTTQNLHGGVTRTERLLATLCQDTFLRLWSYVNPFNESGKELCDLIAVFGDHVFIFFDRESRKFDKESGDIITTWQRWKKETIDKQIKTALGAERYLKRSGKVFLDQKNTMPFPLAIPGDPIVHKIVVAHGAEEACKAFSDKNVYGSLGITYADSARVPELPFLVSLQRQDRIHVLDSHNLKILLAELDTFYDLSEYFKEKERAIRQYQFLSYCGEEDLLAHYYVNYDERNNKYRIGTEDLTVNGLHVGEGEWRDFSKSGPYLRRKEENKQSYFWDELIQRTCDNFLSGTLIGDSNFYSGEGAIVEMAREPRFSRRTLCQHIFERVDSFPTPSKGGGTMRHMATMPSFFSDRMFIFLQVQIPDGVEYDQYRVVRRNMLEIACGVTKNKFPHLKKIIGIAVEPPKLTRRVAEDFVLLDCEEWSEQNRINFEKDNAILRFYETQGARQVLGRTSDFPLPRSTRNKRVSVGRNDACPCGSGKKYKKCCIQYARHNPQQPPNPPP